MDPPPDLELCLPGEAGVPDEGLVANCTALTKPVGDWVLSVVENGGRNCDW